MGDRLNVREVFCQVVILELCADCWMHMLNSILEMQFPGLLLDEVSQIVCFRAYGILGLILYEDLGRL